MAEIEFRRMGEGRPENQEGAEDGQEEFELRLDYYLDSTTLWLTLKWILASLKPLLLSITSFASPAVVPVTYAVSWLADNQLYPLLKFRAGNNNVELPERHATVHKMLEELSEMLIGVWDCCLRQSAPWTKQGTPVGGPRELYKSLEETHNVRHDLFWTFLPVLAGPTSDRIPNGIIRRASLLPQTERGTVGKSSLGPRKHFQQRSASCIGRMDTQVVEKDAKLMTLPSSSRSGGLLLDGKLLRSVSQNVCHLASMCLRRKRRSADTLLIWRSRFAVWAIEKFRGFLPDLTEPTHPTARAAVHAGSNKYGDNRQRQLLPNDSLLRKSNNASKYARVVVIDGSNVAMAHGYVKSKRRLFSSYGIQTAIDYFVRRGFRVICIVPNSVLDSAEIDGLKRAQHMNISVNIARMPDDLSVLHSLREQGEAFFHHRIRRRPVFYRRIHSYCSDARL